MQTCQIQQFGRLPHHCRRISNVPAIYENSAAKRGQQHLRIARTLGRIDTVIGRLNAPQAASAGEFVRDNVAAGDLLVIKGSRGVGTEAVVEALRGGES